MKSNTYTTDSCRAARTHQGGRGARPWLDRNAGLAAIGAGYPLAFAGALVPMPADYASALLICAACLVGFGLGWHVRTETGGGDGRD